MLTSKYKAKNINARFYAITAIAVCLGVVYVYSSFSFSGQESTSAQSPAPAGQEWKVFYADEFDGSTLNTNNWQAYYNTYGDGNQEEACLTPNNISVSNGTLKIISKRETITCPNRPTDNFSSGFLGSREKGKYYPAFGRYEIRAKLPHGQGLWPAFWLRHSAGAGVAEIDVMEYFHAQVPGRTSQTLHFPQEIGSNVAKKATAFEAPTTSPQWHTWSVEILPTNESGTAAKIIMYTNGVKTLEYTPTSFGWLNNYDKNAMFDMAINTAVGGTYNGHPDDDLGFSRYLNKCLKPYNGTPPCDSSGILRASFPANYEIDYVRVYTLEDVVTTKAGDINGDSKVDVFDLSILLSNWNRTDTARKGDINNDGVVNVFDLSILLSNWTS